MYKLKLKHHFDSAHRLKLNYDSKCEGIHGHRWEVIIEIWKNTLDDNGMIIDFSKLKGKIDELDHKMLNDMVKFNPTAENLSKYLHDEFMKLGVFERLKLTIYESPGASISYEMPRT